MAKPATLALVLLAGLASSGSSEGPDLAAPSELSVSERILGREIAMAHPPLDEPEVRSVAEADHMQADDVVAGLLVSGEARAYPWWVLKNYHAVNDRLGGQEVLVAFCEQCSGASAFQRRLGDRVLSMETEGVFGGTIVLRDRETHSLWAPFEGVALEGPLQGEELVRLPTFLTTWQDWQKRHPTTTVVYEKSELRRGHGAREHPGKWGVVGEIGETMLEWDTRLSENELVYGAVEPEAVRAYPRRQVRERGGVVNDLLAGRPLVVISRGDFEMAGYDRRVEGRTLSFESVSQGLGHLRDLETGSQWTIEGEAVGGPLRGSRLEPLRGYPVEWHVWFESHPNTELFGVGPYSPPSGFRLPFSTLPRLMGEKVKTDSLRLSGEVSLIVIWARWCPPCREKIPLLKRLAAEAETGGYRFLSIAVQLLDQVELSGLKGFVFEYGIDWPIYLFNDGLYEELDRHYRDQGGRGLLIPTAFITDRTGTVVRVLEGGELDTVDAALAAVLERAATKD